jgi:hypothetical protein
MTPRRSWTKKKMLNEALLEPRREVIHISWLASGQP